MNRLILVLAFILPLPATAEEFGRLFFTPAERQQLEQQARQAQRNTGQKVIEGDDEHNVITVNGMIQRADGSRIVWINGNAQILPPGSDIPVTVPGKKQPVRAKVGQRIVIDVPPASAKARKDEEED